MIYAYSCHKYNLICGSADEDKKLQKFIRPYLWFFVVVYYLASIILGLK